MNEDRRPGRKPRTSRILAVVSPLVALGWFAAWSYGGEEAESGVRAGFASHRPAMPTRLLRSAPGERLATLFARGGLSGPDARRLEGRLRPWVDRLADEARPEARFHAWPGTSPERIGLRLDRDVSLELTLRGAVWDLRVDSVAATPDTAVVTGIVRSGLWSAELGGDAERLEARERAGLISELASVFAWQLDFYRDPAPGDAFRVVLERWIRPDGSRRETRVLAAEYGTDAGRLRAFRFEPAATGAPPAFYDAEGVPLRGAFRRAPLDLVRVTSRFARARYHPVLRAYRSHAGIDYGASPGTPVRATGTGNVVRAGWAGDYGLLVELAHAGGVRTRYAHLGGIADELAPGVRVEQGTVIGAVGSTGLATGPHLHYEFRLRGRPVDPSTVEGPAAAPLAADEGARFERDVARLRRWLQAAHQRPHAAVRSGGPDSLRTGS